MGACLLLGTSNHIGRMPSASSTSRSSPSPPPNVFPECATTATFVIGVPLWVTGSGPGAPGSERRGDLSCRARGSGSVLRPPGELGGTSEDEERRDEEPGGKDVGGPVDSEPDARPPHATGPQRRDDPHEHLRVTPLDDAGERPGQQQRGDGGGRGVARGERRPAGSTGPLVGDRPLAAHEVVHREPDEHAAARRLHPSSARPGRGPSGAWSARRGRRPATASGTATFTWPSTLTALARSMVSGVARSRPSRAGPRRSRAASGAVARTHASRPTQPTVRAAPTIHAARALRRTITGSDVVIPEHFPASRSYKPSERTRRTCSGGLGSRP